MAKTAVQAVDDKPTAVESLEAVGWYHYGMIPATGTVLLRVPDKANGGKDTLKEFDTWDLFNGNSGLALVEEGDLSMFVAKFRQRVTADVRGCVFPCVSEAVEWRQGDFAKTAFPGNVMRATAEAVQKIVQSSFRHFIRFKFGIEKMMHPDCQVEMHDMAHGAKPDNYTDEEWREYKRRQAAPIQSCPPFNPRTDKLTAEFVYLTKIERAGLETDFDEEAYLKNPNVFHARLVGPVTKSFFTNPPKSVFEMYTPEGLLK